MAIESITKYIPRRLNSFTGALSLGLTGYNLWGRYKRGEDISSLVDKAIIEQVSYMVVPWLAWANAAFKGTRGLINTFYNNSNLLMSVATVNRVGFGGFYRDTLPIATMRQAGVQAIRDQQLKARYILGQEASLMR